MTPDWWSNQKQQILQHFTGRGWFRPADLQQLTGMPNYVSTLLSQMVEAGDLIRDGHYRCRRYIVAADYNAVHNCPTCQRRLHWRICPDCDGLGHDRDAAHAAVSGGGGWGLDYCPTATWG